jgi:hypothetical protein
MPLPRAVAAGLESFNTPAIWHEFCSFLYSIQKHAAAHAMRQEIRMFRNLLLVVLLCATFTQVGCAALAGGVVGGVIGHEVAEDEDDD